MYILHIETATKICSVALSHHDRLVAWTDHVDEMNHTAVLSPTVDQMLRDNGVKITELAAISVSSGPGSYTGLRVGGSTAKAFAYTLGIPLIAIPTLESLANAALSAGQHGVYALPMIDARRDEVYTSLFSSGMKVEWPVLAAQITSDFFFSHVPTSGRVVCIGDGAHKVMPFLGQFEHLEIDETILPSARHLVPLAYNRFLQNRTEDPMHFTPFYVKPPNITQAKNLV